MSDVNFRELRHAPAMPVNFAKAVMRARVKPGKNPQLPNVGLRLNDVGLDAGHLAAYRKVCGFSDDGRLPVHSLLATGAVHHHLIKQGLRADANIVVESASARDSHQIACLLGFGATAVYPYLAYSVLEELIRCGEVLGEPSICYKNYRKGINKGLLKIMSKMGISAVSSYRGAQLFEAVGLSREVVDTAFCGVASRIEGSGFEELEREQQQLAARAWTSRKGIEQGGLLKYVHGQEYHAFNPDVVMTLQQAVASGDYVDYQRYAALVNERPVATLRDLLKPAEGVDSISLDQAEPAENILPPFNSPGSFVNCR